jgi:hypothetical protein
MFERSYLDDYCSRTENQAVALAAVIIPKLLDIQYYYRAHQMVRLIVAGPEPIFATCEPNFRFWYQWRS